MYGRCCSDCKPLQVVLLEWLWEQWGLNLPLQDHDQWACEHTHSQTHTHLHTYLLTRTQLGSQSSLNRPLTVACLAMRGERAEWRPALWRHRLQTHAAHTTSIHLSLTRCCESTDNLLQFPNDAHIVPTVSSLSCCQRATLKGWFHKCSSSSGMHVHSFGFFGAGLGISVFYDLWPHLNRGEGNLFYNDHI